MTDEDEFRDALRKRDVGGSLKKAVPVLVSGVVALAAGALLWFLWPFGTIPIVILIGLPILVGAGAYLVTERALGLR